MPVRPNSLSYERCLVSFSFTPFAQLSLVNMISVIGYTDSSVHKLSELQTGIFVFVAPSAQLTLCTPLSEDVIEG